MKNITYVMLEFSNEANRVLRAVLETGAFSWSSQTWSLCECVCASACVHAGFGLLFPTCSDALQNYVLRI